MQRADARIAAPGERELARAARADQLVVDEVGRHAHEMQVAPALADQLVAGRERDEVREALEREAGAVGDVLRDRSASGRNRVIQSTTVRDCSRR